MTNPSNWLSGTPVYNLKGHLAYVQQLHAKYPLNNQQRCTNHAAKIFDIIQSRKPLPKALQEISLQCIYQLFESMDVYQPGVPTIEHREILQQYQVELTDKERIPKAEEAVVSAFFAIQDCLPPDGESSLSAPASSVMKECSAVITHLMHAFNEYPGIANNFRENAVELSKSKKITLPTEYAGDPTDYLRSTPFAPVFSATVPFKIDRKSFSEHGALFAKSGHGKTQTLRAIVASFIQEEDPPALVIIDSLGSLIEGIADLEVFQTRLKDRLVILDPSDPRYLPSLNFFQLQSDDLCFYLFKAIDQSFTQRQATMISYLMELMRNIKDATLLTLIEVCEAKENPYPQAVQNLSQFAQAFFQNQFFAKKPDQLVQQTKSQIAARIYTLARMPKFQEMFTGTAGTAFDPFTCMQQKKIVLINTDARPPRLGGLGDGSSVFGRFVLAQCLDAARGRPKNERHLALLVVDEAKAYMDDQAALILSDARQFGMGLLLATQFPHQLEEGVRREINTNTSIKLMGPVEFAVASQYARDMHTTPEFIMSMKAVDRSHAEWAAFVANTTDKALRLRVNYGVLEALPKRAGPPFATSGPTTAAPSGISPVVDAASAPSIRQTHELSDIELVVTTARRLESHLTSRYGAIGLGLHEKLTSVQDKLPPRLVYCGRQIANVRNKIVHRHDFVLPDRQRFITYAQEIESLYAETQKAPEGASRADMHTPAKADTPRLPLPDEDPAKAKSGLWKEE
jgi:Helicase HerA, central domain